MDYGIKLSYTTAIILQAIANGYQYGFDIIDVTGMPSGTVYLALRRFEEVGLCDSRWEADDVAEREQRSPRRYYELTKDGRAALAWERGAGKRPRPTAPSTSRRAARGTASRTRARTSASRCPRCTPRARCAGRCRARDS